MSFIKIPKNNVSKDGVAASYAKIVLLDGSGRA
jgi:hypothetical protein